MVTHNPELGELTDRVIYLHHGKFVKEEIHENKFVKLLAISAVILAAFLVKTKLLRLVKKHQISLPMIYKVKK